MSAVVCTRNTFEDFTLSKLGERRILSLGKDGPGDLVIIITDEHGGSKAFCVPREWVNQMMGWMRDVIIDQVTPPSKPEVE